jgi:hypothetical protein
MMSWDLATEAVTVGVLTSAATGASEAALAGKLPSEVASAMTTEAIPSPVVDLCFLFINVFIFRFVLSIGSEIL